MELISNYTKHSYWHNFEDSLSYLFAKKPALQKCMRVASKVFAFIACVKGLATARSTVAPFGTRPTVGVLITTLLPSNPSAPKPPTIKLPCAMAYTLPSTPFRNVCSKVPPLKLPALPIEDTVISIF